MAQCVFDRGVLIAFHANERVREGANGSASVKRSVDTPRLRDDLGRLGMQLGWNGALSVDAIADGDSELVIDVNPRLVEPGNAWAAGTDLVAAMLAVAQGQTFSSGPSRTGVVTHQLLMGILGSAQQRGTRRAVFGEIVDALRHGGAYRSSHEELLPAGGDWRTLALPIAVSVATLTKPSTFRWFVDGAVAHYALQPVGWDDLCRLSPAPA